MGPIAIRRMVGRQMDNGKEASDRQQAYILSLESQLASADAKIKRLSELNATLLFGRDLFMSKASEVQKQNMTLLGAVGTGLYWARMSASNNLAARKDVVVMEEALAQQPAEKEQIESAFENEIQREASQGGEMNLSEAKSLIVMGDIPEYHAIRLLQDEVVRLENEVRICEKCPTVTALKDVMDKLATKDQQLQGLRERLRLAGNTVEAARETTGAFCFTNGAWTCHEGEDDTAECAVKMGEAKIQELHDALDAYDAAKPSDPKDGGKNGL